VDLEVIWRIIDEGSTPAIALIAYLIWKIDKSIGLFISEIKAQHAGRDEKLDEIHGDMRAFIRKLADMDNR